MNPPYKESSEKTWEFCGQESIATIMKKIDKALHMRSRKNNPALSSVGAGLRVRPRIVNLLIYGEGSVRIQLLEAAIEHCYKSRQDICSVYLPLRVKSN